MYNNYNNYISILINVYTMAYGNHTDSSTLRIDKNLHLILSRDYCDIIRNTKVWKQKLKNP